MPTISGGYLKGYYDMCASLGVPEAKLLTLIPGKTLNLEDPTYQFPISVLYDILRLTLQKSDQKTMGLQSPNYFRPGSHGVAGQGLMACSSLREGAVHLNRYEVLMQQYGRTYVTTEAPYTWVGWETYQTDPDLALILTDASIAHHVRYLRWLTQDNDMEIKLIYLQHPKPDYHTRYEELWGCPVLFGQSRNAIALDLEMIDFPLPQGNSSLLRGICKNLDIALKQISTQVTITQRTWQSIENLMPKGTIDLPTIAADLGLGDRHFRRLLQDEGTSFRLVLQDVRRTLCERFIVDDNLSMTEISERLGYSEQSAFSRAFKNWYGQTPKAYAKANAAGG